MHHCAAPVYKPDDVRHGNRAANGGVDWKCMIRTEAASHASTGRCTTSARGGDDEVHDVGIELVSAGLLWHDGRGGLRCPHIARTSSG